MILPDDNLENMLEQTMRESNLCRKCGAAFTFEVGASGAMRLGITDKVLMCPKCDALYEVEVTSAGVKLASDVTSKYKAKSWDSKLNEKGRSNLNKMLDELGPEGRDKFYTVLCGLTEAEAANMAIVLNVASPDTTGNLATVFNISSPKQLLDTIHNSTPVNEHGQAALGALVLAVLCILAAFFWLSDSGWRTGSLALGILMAIAAVVNAVLFLVKKAK